jgi:DNA-binding winged helix-turn-helix (wHTH) protein/predicted ATPase
MPNIYVVGPFSLDTQNDLLFRGGERVALGQRAVALLRALVERPGVVVSKDTLIEAAWPDQAVEESNLSVQIAAVRRTLGRVTGGHRWIETIPRRGYRFVGPVVTEKETGVIEVLTQAGPAPDPATPPHNAAERRQITVMSCRLIGSVERADGLDLEDLRDAVGVFWQCIAAVVGRHDGRIAYYLGNTALVLFGYPAVREHNAEQAVRAGLELCVAVATPRSGADVRMQCRVGIATGLVIIGDAIGGGENGGPEIVGDIPDLAVLLQVSAQPNTVAIDPATRRLIGRLFDCRDLGAIETSARPIRHWQVAGERLVGSRFEALRGSALSPLIGRDEEIDLLLRRWGRAKAGNGQIVLISGEPGIGKSRLVATLAEHLHAEPYLRLRYLCSPHHQDSALSPFVDQLGRAAGFTRDERPIAKLEKLEGLLARAEPTHEDLGLIADLLSLPGSERHSLPNLTPQRKKEKTLEALIRQLDGLARRQPVVVVFEDAQWIDPTSRELLDLAVERLRSLPVLLIVTYRPEFQAPWPGQPQVTMLALNCLDRRDRTALIAQIASGKSLPDEVIAHIVDRTDGVPLFIEEVTKSVLESGLLREEQDRYILESATSSLMIPATLHASLLARLDRLGSARRVAQIGAAIGREFSYPLLRAVSRLPDGELEAALARLVASELVFQRGAPPDAVYRFKHALVQDAAHDGLLRNPRRQLHAQIVEALETHFPELMENRPAVFARHYAEAGLIEKSITYWAKAGHQSIARSAMAEAAAQYQKTLEQLALLPDTPERQWRELEYWSGLGTVLRAVKGQAAPESGQAYSRARQLWEQLGSPSEFLRIPHALSLYHMNRGELHLALRLDEEMLGLSHRRKDSAGLVLSHHSAGRNLMFAGRLTASRSHLEAGLALYDPDSHRLIVHQAGTHPPVSEQAVLGLVLFCLGFPDQALARSIAAIAEAQSLGHSPSLAGSLAFGAKLLSLGGDNAMLEDWVDQLIAVATEQGFLFWGALGTIYRGWISVKNGEVTEGISLLRRGSSVYRATGAKTWVPHHISLLARACEIVGQIEEAMALLDDALQIVEQTGECWFVAELNRLKGELLQRQEHTEAAEELYRQALSIAREQEAKLWELRAAVSLARLWGEQGRRIEARNLLAPIYCWFTEGFGTRDLKEAKALLDKLM